MPRRRRSKNLRLLDILPSLMKMVPVIKLERIEKIYPVFQDRSICLKRDRISLQRAARSERMKIANGKAATNKKVAINGKAVTNKKPTTNYKVPASIEAVTNDKKSTYEIPPTNDKVNNKVLTNDKTNDKVLNNDKVLTSDKVSSNYRVSTNNKMPTNYKVAANYRMATVNHDDDDDDDVNDDALFEYEVDFDNLAQDVTITTEIIKDDKQDTVVVNLVPETRTLIDLQEEELPKTVSSGVHNGCITSGVAEANADNGQTCEGADIQAYSPSNGDMEHVESDVKGNAENQDSDDDVIVLLDIKKQGTENKEQQQLSNTEQQPSNKEQQLSNTEQQSNSKPAECTSILSTSWALADCVSAQSHTRFTEEVEMVECLDDEDDNNTLNKISYPCTRCNQLFLSQHSLFTHTCSKSESNQGSNGFLCPWCERQFYILNDLKQHVKNCWNGMLTCVICSIIICGKIAIIRHLQEHKKNSSQVQTREKACLVCGLFDEKWNLVEHWRGHTGVNLLECVVCKKVLALNRLKSHLINHRQSDPAWSDLNWCHICGLTFMNRGAYFNHKNGHSTKRYSHLCEKCGLFFEKFDDLEQHTLYHVDQNTIYKCTKCHRIYPFRTHFDIHCKTCFKLGDMDLTKVSTQALLRGIREKYLRVFNTHTLDLIHYAFRKDNAEMAHKAHTKQMEPQDSQKVSTKQIKEPQDSYKAPTKQDSSSGGICVMKLRKEDSGVILYSCQVCQRKFVAKESFQRHWRDHTGFDPNKCVICSETFAIPKLLEIHVSIAHSSCFKCSNCSMIFGTSLEQKYHTLAHKKKHIHFCEVCGAGFSNFNYLEYHVFTNHVKECQIRNCPPITSSAPVDNCSTSTHETQSIVNGIARNTSYERQSSRSHGTTTANFSAAVASGGTLGMVGNTSYVLQSPGSPSTTAANFSAAVAGRGTWGMVGDTSYILQSPGSHRTTVANFSTAVAGGGALGIVGDTSYILQSSQNHNVGMNNFPTAVASGSAVNLHPLISNSNISSSGALTNQGISITDSSPMQLNAFANVLPKPSAAVSVMQQTREVIHPPLHDLYLCTICKVMAPDLPTMVEHSKTHKM